MSELPSYILITPARNEAQFIELALKSVVTQTVRPLRWIIVSDGSTDRTDEIVKNYAAEHPWIELVQMRTEKLLRLENPQDPTPTVLKLLQRGR